MDNHEARVKEIMRNALEAGEVISQLDDAAEEIERLKRRIEQSDLLMNLLFEAINESEEQGKIIENYHVKVLKSPHI